MDDVAAPELLTTTEAVIAALGGVSGVAKLTGRQYTAAHNWLSWPTFPPDTYVVMIDELGRRGKSAPHSLWRMVEPQAAS